MENKYKIEIATLKHELESSKKIIQELQQNSSELKKAIWDMLNYANMYVLILDKDMTVELINWSLATELGFKEEKEVIGKCWVDFIPEEYRDLIKVAHFCLVHKEGCHQYKEMANEVQRLDGTIFLVKWFNIPINHNYNMTLSMGLKTDINESTIVSEDSIRSYYRDIIAKDRTMIQSLKDIAIKGLIKDPTCKD